MSVLAERAALRRTFAIISHPDAGKTTLTEKLLLFGGAIQLAGTVKGRKATRHATSDWMALEQQRGISITTSVMQFPYNGKIVNLLDTPGHEDFSEDTYRTLTAVDSALMVIDAAKGVENRTIKLMEVCRLRDTPIVTFVNKLDREGRPPLELLDEVEKVLGLNCTPITWPLGMGRDFKGVYHLLEDRFYLYSGDKHRVSEIETLDGLLTPGLEERFGRVYRQLRDEIELLQMAGTEFDLEQYRAAKLTPVFFGAAINNFGVRELLNGFTEWAPPPQPRIAQFREQPHEVFPEHEKFSGFVFKIQANMDPRHRDRVAFLRVCSGVYRKGMALHSVRLNGPVRVSNALVFMADDRESVEEAYPGDIIGLHNHGTISIGDSFSEGEALRFTGIPTSRRTCSVASSSRIRSKPSSSTRVWTSCRRRVRRRYTDRSPTTTSCWAQSACCSLKSCSTDSRTSTASTAYLNRCRSTLRDGWTVTMPASSLSSARRTIPDWRWTTTGSWSISPPATSI